MSQPVVQSPITPTGASLQASGLYKAYAGDQVKLTVVVTSSGNAAPLTQTIVDWGDGTADRPDFRQVGRSYGFTHQYDVGTYAVVVTTVNAAGEVSDPVTVPIFVEKRPDRVAAPRPQYSGLATPGETLAQGVQALHTVVDSSITTLAAPTTEGDEQVVIRDRVETISPNTRLTISQTGKLITYVRVKSVDAVTGVISLFGALNDSYSQGANVVIESEDVTLQGSSQVQPPYEPWYFPTTTGIDLVRAAFRSLMMTRPGERVMRPEVGCLLFDRVFEPNDLVLQEQARQDILGVAALEPRALVDALEVSRDENDLIVRVTAHNAGETAVYDVETTIPG